MSSDKRRSLRTPLNFRVKVAHPALGTGLFRTGDVSDGGVFLQPGDFELAAGDVVSVQIQDVPIEAPIVSMVVVRAGPDGFGLKFAE